MNMVTLIGRLLLFSCAWRPVTAGRGEYEFDETANQSVEVLQKHFVHAPVQGRGGKGKGAWHRLKTYFGFGGIKELGRGGKSVNIQIKPYPLEDLRADDPWKAELSKVQPAPVLVLPKETTFSKLGSMAATVSQTNPFDKLIKKVNKFDKKFNDEKFSISGSIEKAGVAQEKAKVAQDEFAKYVTMMKNMKAGANAVLNNTYEEETAHVANLKDAYNDAIAWEPDDFKLNHTAHRMQEAKRPSQNAPRANNASTHPTENDAPPTTPTENDASDASPPSPPSSGGLPALPEGAKYPVDATAKEEAQKLYDEMSKVEGADRKKLMRKATIKFHPDKNGGDCTEDGKKCWCSPSCTAADQTAVAVQVTQFIQDLKSSGFSDINR